MVISNLSMFQTNTPLTYCVGIDKEKEIAESACTKAVFYISFLQFYILPSLSFTSRKALQKLCFCGAFCF